MGIGRWIAGTLGWVIAGPIGGIIGFILGSALDKDKDKNTYNPNSRFNQNTSYTVDEQRNSFLVSLLVLSATVMKSDGKVMKSELEYVKDFIRRNFGENAVAQALQILKEVLKKDINLPEVCAQIKLYMASAQRLQLLHYLVGIAQADGHVTQSEIDDIKNISKFLGISAADCNSILAMFENSIESAYKVLEIEPTATDEEVKKAYKKMAIKHHPDKVEQLGSDVKKAAEEKFKAVVAAYETIKKERGFN